MTDENQNEEVQDTKDSSASPPVQQSQPFNSAHPVEEDPEQHIGEVTKDPWKDDSQTDWENSTHEAAAAAVQGTQEEAAQKPAEENTETPKAEA